MLHGYLLKPMRSGLVNCFAAKEQSSYGPLKEAEESHVSHFIGYPTEHQLLRFQLDELWFTLDVDLLLSALGITPKDPAHPFVAPPAEDLVIDFVNNLGYPEELQFVSKIPRHPVIQMLWGVVTGTNVDYAELIWEEFVRKSTKPTPSKKANMGKVIKVQKGKRSDRLVDEAEEEPLPASKPPMDDDEYNLQRGI
ncbi:hypothetical protein Tco_1413803 [Tanacetum coccineum]